MFGSLVLLQTPSCLADLLAGSAGGAATHYKWWRHELNEFQRGFLAELGARCNPFQVCSACFYPCSPPTLISWQGGHYEAELGKPQTHCHSCSHHHPCIQPISNQPRKGRRRMSTLTPNPQPPRRQPNKTEKNRCVDLYLTLDGDTTDMVKAPPFPYGSSSYRDSSTY